MGMVLILIFAEVLGLYGCVTADPKLSQDMRLLIVFIALSLHSS